MEGKMKKLSLLVLLLLCCDVFSMDDGGKLRLLPNGASQITVEDVQSAEERLNQPRDPKIHSDIVLILKYLLYNGWTTVEVGVFFKSSSDRVELLLSNDAFCDLITNVHRHYMDGGESVIGLKPSHERTTNWFSGLTSCFPSWCNKPNTSTHIKAH